jgi:pimeloyl-ACP methyl ester carboxylesterase
VQWVESDGVKLHTDCLGSGPLLVMCHGLITANLATWYFSAAPALARHYRVVLYDLRGHGKSALAPNGYDVETMTRDLARVIDAYRSERRTTRSEKVALVGHSYGALIALNYALRYPQSVARLALIDAPLPAAHYVYPSLAGIDSLFSLQRLLPAHPQEHLRRGLRQGRRSRERLEFLLLHSSLREDLRAAGDVPDAQLKALNISTLCLYGRHSDCAAAGRRLASLLPRGELRWLESDHFIPTRVPMEMTAELLSYFAHGTQEATDYAVHDGSG